MTATIMASPAQRAMYGNVYNDSTGTLTKGRFPTGCITVTPEATPTPSVCDGPNHYTDPSYTLKPVTGVVYTVDGVVQAADALERHIPLIR